jgi:hypothetical protein
MHQHGFRKSYSTETALLTLQGMIADVLDSGRQGIIYSVDLSAAFDLLRPDKFAELFKNKLSEGLIFAVIDFLMGRKFCVNLNNNESEVKSLDRGCVQGSVLGPKLFSLYMSELGNIVGTNDKQVQVISYADDSYVVIAPEDIDNISELTEKTLSKHINYLKGLSMIVNETKTEMMWLGANQKLTMLKLVKQ